MAVGGSEQMGDKTRHPLLVLCILMLYALWYCSIVRWSLKKMLGHRCCTPN